MDIKKQWLVMNIGCLHHGVTSAIVGVFSDRSVADTIANAFNDKFSLRQGGPNVFLVFEIPEINIVANEYIETKSKEILLKAPTVSMDIVFDKKIHQNLRQILSAEGINSIDELISKTAYQLLKVPNLGPKKLNIIKINLSLYGLKLNEWRDSSEDKK